MKAKARILSIILIISSLSVACGGKEPSGDTTSAIGITSDTTDVETDRLPDKDYSGREVNMLVRTEFLYEFRAEESGDVVDDAVYARNRAIEEKFNVAMNIVDVTGTYTTRDTYINTISSDVLSGSGEYDLFASAANYMLPTVIEGYYLDLTKVPYVDLTQPWWSQGYVENLSIDGSLYLASGSASINLLENMSVIFFNKQMLKDYGFEEPYELVKSGKWTIDKLMSQAVIVNADLNGDEKMTIDDRIGLLTYGNMVTAQTISFGLPFTQRDSEGYPRLTYMSERMMKAFDLIKSYVSGSQLVVYSGSGDTLEITSNMQKAFQNNNILYMAQLLSSAQVMRAMETDFGIIPMPKLDEEQERYYTCVLENMTVLGIPTSAKEPELSGLVLEMLAEEGYKSVVPTYFGKALGTKYIRDEASNDMLNLILETVWFDFAYLNSVSLGGINHLFNNSLSGSLVSSFESSKSSFESKLETLIEGYKELKQ
jgi:ABC-type glycerol-3-phosphate transport system substrate-binding protein